MIEAQVAPFQGFSTILACIPVPPEDIVAVEPDSPFREAVKGEDNDDPGDLDEPVHRADYLIGTTAGKLSPAFEIEESILGINNLCDAIIEKTKGFTDSSHMDRIKSPVHYENR